MSDFTFLTEEQCIGVEKLDILQKRGTKAAITDFSILLGGRADDKNYIDGDNSLEGRTGDYWIKSDDNGLVTAPYIGSEGKRFFLDSHRRENGARPALPFSSIFSISTNEVGGVPKRGKDGVLEVEYGYYPQKAVSRHMQKILERAYMSYILIRTGNKYTTDSEKMNENEFVKAFLPKQYEEFELNGKRYVRVEATSNCFFRGKEFELSNGERYEDGDPVWVEVLPIKWLADEKEKIMVTEKIMFAGIQYRNNCDGWTGFEELNIKHFMDTYFAPEIEQVRQEELSKNMQAVQRRRRTRLEKLNPDRAPVENRRQMTDTELIEDWLASGESVLLRGPSGIGKTERIKTICEENGWECIPLKLTNGMFPEKVVGSMNLQTGQSIPPDYYKTIIMEGATEGERKQIEANIQNIFNVADKVNERVQRDDSKIILLLDELMNVNEKVQSLVYTLVLNRMVEIGKGLNLPDNVVIVATGNQKKYSSAANDLVEPLEKRFDHIFDMKPKVWEWITGYAMPKKLHPAVIGYMLSKYDMSGRSEEIKDMGYFYEEPEVGEEHIDENGSRGMTNDPRGWTAVSKLLYDFERKLVEGRYEGKDVEQILKMTIGTKLREEWAEEFFDYYNMPTLTPEEVAKKEYTEEDLPRRYK